MDRIFSRDIFKSRHIFKGSLNHMDNALEPEADQLLTDDDRNSSSVFSSSGFKLSPKNANFRRRMLCWVLVSMAERIYMFQAFPYLPEFIEETGATGGDSAKVGYLAGLTETAYSISGGLFILQWARLSDKIGRKPVFLLGLVGVALSAICFGLSTTFQMIILSRILLGVLNVTETVLRSSMGDVLAEDDFARAVAWLPGVWCMSAISGPLIGGSLSHPNETFPDMFGKFEIWITHPFLLPNLVVVGITVIIFIVIYKYFEETLPTLQKYDPSLEAYVLQESEPDSPKFILEHQGPSPSPSILSLLDRRLILLLSTNMINTFLDASFGTILPVILATPVETGGFGLSSSQIGIAIALAGTLSGFIIIFAFPLLHSRLGNKNLLRLGFCGLIGSFSVFACARTLNRTGSGVVLWMSLLLLCMFYTLALMIPNCLTLLLTNGTRADALGAVNGLSQTTASVTRALGPVIGGSLLSLSFEKQYLGGNLVYYVLSAVALLGFFIARFIPSIPTEVTKINV